MRQVSYKQVKFAQHCRPISSSLLKHTSSNTFNRTMSSTASTQSSWQYPVVRRDSTTGDIYPGDCRVPDPYRWLEDPDAKETEDFVSGQNEITAKYLAGFKDSVELRKAVEGVFSYEKFSCPNLKKDGFYYWSYNPALLNQAQIWRSRTIDRKEPELFFDPNLLSDDGTISLGSSSFSKDGKYFAYSISKSGSDNNTIYVKKTTTVDTLERMTDEVAYVKFSGISWSKDSQGFVYQRFANCVKSSISELIVLDFRKRIIVDEGQQRMSMLSYTTTNLALLKKTTSCSIRTRSILITCLVDMSASMENT